jgi:hypothetical protein
LCKEGLQLTDTGTFGTPHHDKKAVVAFDNAEMLGLPYSNKSLANSRSLISNAQVEAFIGVVGQLPWGTKAIAGENTMFDGNRHNGFTDEIYQQLIPM